MVDDLLRQATASSLGQVRDVSVDGVGNVSIADPDYSVIEQVSSAGILSILAGTGLAGVATPGPATSSSLACPMAVASDGVGNVDIADAFGGADQCGEVERVAPGGSLSVIGGTSLCSSAIAGPALASPVTVPVSLAVDAQGNLEVTVANQVLVIDLPTSPHGPGGVSARRSASGVQVRWRAPAALECPVVGYVATVTDANGVVIATCTAGRSGRSCSATIPPGSAPVEVAVVVTERSVPQAPSGLMTFSSGTKEIPLG